jgi:hypothetical protein
MRDRTAPLLSPLALAGLAVVLLASPVVGQSNRNTPGPSQPAASNPAAPKPITRADFNLGDRRPDEPPLNAYLTYDNPQRWTARTQVDIAAFEFTTRAQVEIQFWSFDTLAVIFPVIRETAAASGDPTTVKGELRVADRPVTTDYTLIQGYHSDAIYTRWDARELVDIREVSLVSESSVRAWETTLNERAASAVGWPKGPYPIEARSTFQTQFGVGYTEFIDDADQSVPGLIKLWTEGRDPKSIPPLQLAKYLAGRVIELVQPANPGFQRGRPRRSLGFEGFRLLGPDRTIAGGRGSPFDIACVLAAVYREAGLPARIVVGLREFDEYDTDDLTREELLGIDALHAYVEFFLYDEDSGDSGWIPVDPVRIRRQSSRAKPLDQAWEYFGTHDELDHFIPLAFHFHPPTTVRAYGSPGLWGWYATPSVPEMAFQQLTFATFNTPVRGRD